MANGRLPAASAPRAGWSAAIIISRPWSPSREVGRRRFAAASAIAAGRPTRVATRSRKRWSSTCGLLACLASTSSAVGIASAHARRPATIAPAALQNRMLRSRSHPARREWHRAPPNASPAPRPLTTSTGTGGTSTCVWPSWASTPFGPCLTIASGTPALVQRPRRRVGLALADGGLALVEVADRDVDEGQRLLDPLAGLLAGGPEHRPVVQVEDGVAAAGPGAQRRQRGLPAGLLGQPGDGDPEDLRVADRVEVELVGVDLHVRRARAAVEVQREVVGREDLAERHRRREVRDRGDVAVVDPEALQGVVQELAERVGAGAGDDRAAARRAGPRPRRRWPGCRRGTCRSSRRGGARSRPGGGRCRPPCGPS